MIYKPKNFRIEELVPEDVYNLRGDKSWELLNPRMLVSVQELREYLNKPVILNNWDNDGDRHNQVFRTADYYDRLSFSQHLLGNAADPFVPGVEAEELRQIVISRKKKGKLEYVTGMEDGVNWLHIDCRATDRLNKDGLFIFSA